MVFLTKTDGYQKMCDTNKNVIKMGMILKGVDHTIVLYYLMYLHKEFKPWIQTLVIQQFRLPIN
jgi:hypothetical protein